MIIKVTVPSPGESITQVQLANWLVSDGDYVEKDLEIAEIDSDKATLAIPAPESGKIAFVVKEGEVIAVGDVICTLDTEALPPAGKKGEPSAVMEKVKKAVIIPDKSKPTFTPLAIKVLSDKGLTRQDALDILQHNRITRKDVENILTGQQQHGTESFGLTQTPAREIERRKMTPLRIKLSERLVAVKNQTAMLTTFNEVNMSAILGIKNKYSEKFKEKFGVSVGFMSFFTKAVSCALEEFPLVNSQIDGDEILVPSYVDMGIAVSGPKGLVVPVIRNIGSLSLADIERNVKELAAKARNNKLSLEEMTGGTFTITNGGVFGSLMSTPIINPPQSAILGMHAIIDRPVAIEGKVVIQPMMYIALSYDHRIIDGRESVNFLVRVKEMLEQPVRLLFQGKNPDTVLLGL